MPAPIGLPPALGSVFSETTLQRTVTQRAAQQPSPNEVANAEQAQAPNQSQSASGPVTPFMEHLEHIIDGADSAQRTAQSKATDFAEHRSNDLHGTMISLGQADIQLRFVASIRNKVVEAYREVMRMGA